MFWVQVLYHLSALQAFSPRPSCLFILLTVPFEEKFLFDEFQFTYFSLYASCFQYPSQFSESFLVLDFEFRLRIHFEIISVKGGKYGFFFFFGICVSN